MSNSLEERLRANSSAFDGLLALIPAKYYYDEKTQDQWKAKKKTKSQVHDDKVKKLDPEQQNEDASTALDIMKQREATAKPVMLPGERMKQMKKTMVKEEVEEVKEAEADGIKVAFDDEGNEIKQSDAESESSVESSVESETEGQKQAALKEKKTAEKKQESEETKTKKQKNLEALRSKLQSRIHDMRTKRKAPGTKVDGAPSSREAILNQRQRKEELKKKRVQSQIQDDDSDSDVDSDDGEPIRKKSKKSKDEDDDINADGVIYQSIMFDDGEKATSDLQRLRKINKKKGPSKNDIKGHLKLLEAKKTTLESKDELEQIKAKEKDKWQRTLLQTEGVKLKDNEKLLRKALKKKEAKKRKSGVEWDERKRVVVQNKADKAKRREENLQIRKDNKGVKRSKQQKMKRKFKATYAPKKRAGFEGRMKSGKKK